MQHITTFETAAVVSYGFTSWAQVYIVTRSSLSKGCLKNAKRLRPQASGFVVRVPGAPDPGPVNANLSIVTRYP